MLTVAEAFETYRKRLELSDTEAKDASRRQNDVRECIAESFDVGNDFLTGSYARHTKTKPLKDVDIFFPINDETSGWREKDPPAVLGEFEKCLVATYGRDAVEPGRRCVTVIFEKKNPTVDEEGKVLSVDAVPAITLEDGFEIPDRVLGEWIKTDPRVHKEQATAKNKELGGHWIPLVKMLKRWNRSADSPIRPSFLVEVMAHGLVGAPFTSYQSEVRRFFAAALDGLRVDWPDPAGDGPPVSDQMTTEKRDAAVVLLRSAEMAASRAVRLETDGKPGAALSIWRDIMGKYFPTR